jgi:hypothetical protein
MIAIHPRSLVDEAGRHVAVQVPVDGFRIQAISAYEAGKASEGEAATMLGITRPEGDALAAAAGSSTCSHTRESLEAELADR